jgi:hypothetical protein
MAKAKRLTLILLLAMQGIAQAQLTNMRDSTAAELMDFENLLTNRSNIATATKLNKSYFDDKIGQYFVNIVAKLEADYKSANDYPSIQAAIDSLGLPGKKGVVWIPPMYSASETYVLGDSTVVLDFREGKFKVDGIVRLAFINDKFLVSTDYDSLGQAIDAIVDSSILYLTPGQYDILASLSVDSTQKNIAIIANGGNSTVIYNAGMDSSQNMLNIYSGTGVVSRMDRMDLYGITFNMGRNGGTKAGALSATQNRLALRDDEHEADLSGRGGWAIYQQGYIEELNITACNIDSSNFGGIRSDRFNSVGYYWVSGEISRCEIRSVYGHGMFFNNGGPDRVVTNRFRHVGTAIYTNSSIFFDGNRVEEYDSTAVLYNGVNWGSISNNVISEGGTGAIKLMNGCNYTTVLYNKILNSFREFNDNTYSPIFFDGKVTMPGTGSVGTNGPRRCLVEGNVLNGQDAIRTGEAKYFIEIEDNVIAFGNQIINNFANPADYQTGFVSADWDSNSFEFFDVTDWYKEWRVPNRYDWYVGSNNRLSLNDTSLVFNTFLDDNGNKIAFNDQFTTTATEDTIVISGLGSGHTVIASMRGTSFANSDAPLTGTNGKVDTVIVRRAAGTTSGLNYSVVIIKQ